MFYLIIGICVLAYGIYYTVNPMRSLKRKYWNEPVPELAVKSARVVGVVIIVIGAVVAVNGLLQLTAG